MGHGAKKAMAAGGVLMLALIVGGVLLLQARPGGEYDRGFDTSVASPIYPATAAEHPLILYDEGHSNTHTMDGAYQPWAMLARNDGYLLRSVREAFTEELLAGASVLAVVAAQGTNDTNDGPAFTNEEVEIIRAWVSKGGSLLLITDHWPFGTAAASLAAAFHVRVGEGLVEDPRHGHPDLGASHILFTSENGLLADHAVTRGRGDAERVRRVLTFTGGSMLGPAEAAPLLLLSETAIEYPPGQPRVERSGGDVRVQMEYGEARPAAGRAQALAIEHERGRIVMLAESGMLRARKEKGGRMTGMNAVGYDNRQLALNILHWLSRAI